MKRPVAARAAPPIAAVQAATPVRSKEVDLEAAEVGEDPDAAVRVPDWETEDERELDADEEDAEERVLVAIEDDADEEEEADDSLRGTSGDQLGKAVFRRGNSETHEVAVACEEAAAVVAPAPASLRGTRRSANRVPSESTLRNTKSSLRGNVGQARRSSRERRSDRSRERESLSFTIREESKDLRVEHGSAREICGNMERTRLERLAFRDLKLKVVLLRVWSRDPVEGQERRVLLGLLDRDGTASKRIGDLGRREEEDREGSIVVRVEEEHVGLFTLVKTAGNRTSEARELSRDGRSEECEREDDRSGQHRETFGVRA